MSIILHFNSLKLLAAIFLLCVSGLAVPLPPATVAATISRNAADNPWSAVGLGGNAITVLTINPQQPSTIYAGTRNNGAWKSTNSGTNWQQLSETGMITGYPYIVFLTLNPTNPNTLYIGKDDGVYRSTNGGASWALYCFLLIRTMVFDPSNATIAYFGGDDNGPGLVIKANVANPPCGNPESLNVANSSFARIAVNPTNSNSVYAANERNLYNTTNGGQTWSITQSGMPNPVKINAIAINPQTPTTMYVATAGSGIYRSLNGGQSWAAVNTGLTSLQVNDLILNPSTPDVMYAATAAGVFATSNMGGQWSAYNTGLTTGGGQPPEVFDLAFAPGATKLYAGTANGIFQLALSNPPGLVTAARRDIGMPYSDERGCASPYAGCGKPYTGFAAGVCTDLVLDGYNAGVFFDLQNVLAQDHRTNPGRYRYGSARNAEDMRRYFSRNQVFAAHSQPYQTGDIAFFDWDGDGITNHVLIISDIDAAGRPLKMIDASDIIPGINPSGRAFEHAWSNYYEQRVQGHARIGSANLTTATTAAVTETLQILRVTVNSSAVGLSLFDSNGKSVSESYNENLVANNIEAAIPYIPGGSYTALSAQRGITVTQPLSNTNQYFVSMKGTASTTYTLLVETLQDASVTASQVVTQSIGLGEVQTTKIAISAPGGVITFTAQAPTPAPIVDVPSSLALSGFAGASTQLTFTISETSGLQAMSNASITATNLSTQYGTKIPSTQLNISPANFSVAAGTNQKVRVQVNLAHLTPGAYLGSVTLKSQSGNPVIIPLTLQVQYHTLYLPSIIKK